MKEYTAFEINCDNCDKGLYDPLSDYGSIFRSDDEAKIACHHQLWEVHGDHHICPDCQTKSNEEPKKQLEPYEQRMVDEYEELRDRRKKLADFLKPELGEFFNGRETRPSKEELAWMTKQVWAMDDYLLVLKNRMKLHGIVVDAVPVVDTAQVRDAFVDSYRNTDSTSKERERLFYAWFNNELAKVWREGAMHGFSQTGEGWNAEWARGPEPDVEAIVENMPNPYGKEE